MNILSLFDGISCGMVALERAGVKVDKYYSSEVDKYAIAISEKNYKKNREIRRCYKVERLGYRLE
nr:MAG TPA: C-5 cytosine-specific DNA methylase [Caudoviricetes sp.]